MVLNVFCTTAHREKRMMITIVKVNSLVSVTPVLNSVRLKVQPQVRTDKAMLAYKSMSLQEQQKIW